MICNRGASGIDGNLGTALGACLASGRPTTALLGDLTFLHDVTALVACAQSNASIRFVVVNNAGGGIFHFLPIAEHDEVFPWFSAPHAVEAAPLASALGVRARRVSGLATLRAILARPPTGVILRREPDRNLAESIAEGDLTVDDLVTRYCRLLYERFGSYKDVARRTGLDWRTVKSKVVG